MSITNIVQSGPGPGVLLTNTNVVDDLIIVDGNPGRVPIPSRDATLPAKPADSARVLLALADSTTEQPQAG